MTKLFFTYFVITDNSLYLYTLYLDMSIHNYCHQGQLINNW